MQDVADYEVKVVESTVVGLALKVAKGVGNCGASTTEIRVVELEVESHGVDGRFGSYSDRLL